MIFTELQTLRISIEETRVRLTWLEVGRERFQRWFGTRTVAQASTQLEEEVEDPLHRAAGAAVAAVERIRNLPGERQALERAQGAVYASLGTSELALVAETLARAGEIGKDL
jgi:hypothetical protein